MDELLPIRRLLAASSDPDNPSAEELRDLFERMRQIAVIGLSRHAEKTARRVPSYLAAKGYEVTPVNPFADRILARTSYATITDVPHEVEMVMVFRPSEKAGPFVDEIARRPERPVIWLQEGIRADAEAARARADGMMVVQDLCAYQVHRALYPAAAPR